MLLATALLVLPGSAESADDSGIWLSQSEVEALPTSGAAFDRTRAVADDSLPGGTNLAERDDHNLIVLAAALVGTALDDDGYRDKARDGLATVVEAEPDSDDVLAAARRLSTYVIAADVLGLAEHDPGLDADFRTWADQMLELDYDGGGGGGTIPEVHERRPNNFGTHAGASRAAVAAYLGDTAELDATATVFDGWLGDRAAYDGFKHDDTDWHANPDRPRGINAAGATVEGHDVAGVLPDDQRRGGEFEWPPPQENYVWGALQGAVVQAELLDRAGHNAWSWQDAALRRSVEWLHAEADFPAEGDDTWVPWIANHAYGTDYPAGDTQPGKNMGFTDWTHDTTNGGSTGDDTDETGDQDGGDDGEQAGGGSAFSDVDGDNPHADAIGALSDSGTISGYPDGTFRPHRSVTRGQFATMLAEHLDLPDGEQERSHQVHGDGIAAVIDAGIADGSADGSFGASERLSRAQLASMLQDALDLEAERSVDFDDVPRDATHAPAIAALAEAGLVEGYPDGTFRPAADVTRGQLASVLVAGTE